MANPQVSLPPYLQYDVPADLARIDAAIKALSDEARKRRSKRHIASVAVSALPGPELTAFVAGVGPTPAAEPAAADVRSRPGPAALAPAEGLAGGRARSPAGRMAAPAELIAEPVAPPDPSALILPQVVTYPVMVTPSGTVPLGFNCRKEFQATTMWPSGQVTHLVWNLLLLNKQTNVYDKIFFMGGSVVDVVTGPVPPTINFEHDFSTYRTAAYTSPAKHATFKVQCRYYHYIDQVAVTESPPVTLDFSVQSCLGIHSVGLSRDTVVGANNQTEPVLYVTLDGPAGPGGQKVLLSTDNSNLGWIHGSGSFVIPQGQQSDSISWFLGTKKVLTTRCFNIVVTLDSPGGKTGPAYAKVYLTRK